MPVAAKCEGAVPCASLTDAVPSACGVTPRAIRVFSVLAAGRFESGMSIEAAHHDDRFEIVQHQTVCKQVGKVGS
jgi:hypothetical protein